MKDFMKDFIGCSILLICIVALLLNLQEVIHWTLTTGQDLGLIDSDIIIPEIKKF